MDHEQTKGEQQQSKEATGLALCHLSSIELPPDEGRSSFVKQSNPCVCPVVCEPKHATKQTPSSNPKRIDGSAAVKQQTASATVVLRFPVSVTFETFRRHTLTD